MQPPEGVRIRFIHCSRELAVTEAQLAKGARVPAHSHPSVQVTIVLEGRLLLRTPGGEQQLGPGDYAVIPPNTPHEAQALEDTRVIDVNAPLTPDREQLAAKLGTRCT